MNVVVYSKPDCQQCVATVRTFKRKGKEVREADLQEYPHVLEYAQAQGWTSAPVVMVHDVTGQLVAAWSGYRPDKIKEVANGHQRGDGSA